MLNWKKISGSVINLPGKKKTTSLETANFGDLAAHAKIKNQPKLYAF